MIGVKFCGMTRAEDAAAAAALGASYVGVILANGPRLLTPERAAELLDTLPASVQRVGVFGPRAPEEIADVAAGLKLDVVQLHGDPDAGPIDHIRRGFGGAVWAVSRIAGSSLPPALAALFDAADAVVVDAFVADRLGGTGIAVAWADIALALDSVRRGRRLVLAGGLRPENVGEAIAAISPDVVDVSSGVESAPGIKDHLRMRAFRDAVRATTVER